MLSRQVKETVDVVFQCLLLKGKVRSQKHFVFWFIMTLGIVLFIDSNIFVANQTSRSSKVNYEKEIVFPLFFKSSEFLSTFLRFDNILRLQK